MTDRLHLFRAQASRSVGGNGRRTSHNPAAPVMLDIYDRIGITVMDENRQFANNSEYVSNMGSMVKRDRNHPSIIIWSFCNEAGCEGSLENGGPRFREARPALLRSWVVFKVPPILERHILRFKPIGIDSQCRAPLRPPTSTSSVF